MCIYESIMVKPSFSTSSKINEYLIKVKEVSHKKKKIHRWRKVEVFIHLSNQGPFMKEPIAKNHFQSA